MRKSDFWIYSLSKKKLKLIYFNEEFIEENSIETSINLLKATLEEILNIQAVAPPEYSETEINNSVISLLENVHIDNEKVIKDNVLMFSYEKACILAFKFYKGYISQCTEKLGRELWNYYFEIQSYGLTYLIQSVIKLVLEVQKFSEERLLDTVNHIVAVYNIMYYAVITLKRNYKLKNFILVQVSKILYMCVDKIEIYV